MLLEAADRPSVGGPCAVTSRPDEHIDEVFAPLIHERRDRLARDRIDAPADERKS